MPNLGRHSFSGHSRTAALRRHQRTAAVSAPTACPAISAPSTNHRAHARRRWQRCRRQGGRWRGQACATYEAAGVRGGRAGATRHVTVGISVQIEVLATCALRSRLRLMWSIGRARGSWRLAAQPCEGTLWAVKDDRFIDCANGSVERQRNGRGPRLPGDGLGASRVGRHGAHAAAWCGGGRQSGLVG